MILVVVAVAGILFAERPVDYETLPCSDRLVASSQSFVRTPLKDVTVGGVALGEPMTGLRERLGVPVAEVGFTLCAMSEYRFYGSVTSDGLHVQGVGAVRGLEGNSLEINGSLKVSHGEARAEVLRKLGRPQFHDHTAGDVGYDLYLPEGVFVGYRADKVERVWVRTRLEESPYNRPMDCCPLEFWYSGATFPPVGP